MKTTHSHLKLLSISIILRKKTSLRRSMKRYYHQLGFSLTELMVVVAIIGILASIAIPQYNKYQRKARQTEAKLMLSGIYTSNLSFNAEWGYSTPNLYQMGFSPSGDILYEVGFPVSSNVDPSTSDPNDVAGGGNVPSDYDGPPLPNSSDKNLISTNNLCGHTSYGEACTVLPTTPALTIPTQVTESGTTYDIKVYNTEKYNPQFTIMAVGNLGGTDQDIWIYKIDTSTKAMLNIKSGL